MVAFNTSVLLGVIPLGKCLTQVSLPAQTLHNPVIELSPSVRVEASNHKTFVTKMSHHGS